MVSSVVLLLRVTKVTKLHLVTGQSHVPLERVADQSQSYRTSETRNQLSLWITLTDFVSGVIRMQMGQT